MKKTLQTADVVAIVTDRVILGVDYRGAYDYCAQVLENAVNFEYNQDKSLPENLLEYYRYAGYPFFKAFCENYITILEENKKQNEDLSFYASEKYINQLAFMCTIPKELRIEIKDDTVKKLVDWQGRKAYCAFCGRALKVYKEDKTGYALGARKCDCQAYQKAKASSKK